MFYRFFSCLLIASLCADVGFAEEPKCEIKDVTWTLGPNLPEFRKGGCATVLDGKVISVFGMRQPWGEMATMYVYDPKTDWWSRGADGPIGQTYVQGTECGGAFYSIGGRSAPLGGVHVNCYRLGSKSGTYAWTQIAGLNEARGWAPSVAVGTKLYVLGGAKSGRGPTLSSVEMLDTAKAGAKWQKMREIPGDSRGWCGAAAVNGQIYLIGGSHFFDPKPPKGSDDRKRLRDVWRLDPSTGQWQARSELPYALAGFDCCVYKDRYIIVVGGAPTVSDFTPEMKKMQQKDRFYKFYYCPFVLVYDTVTDRWHRMDSVMPMPTNDIRVVLAGDTLYAIGGENVEPATSNTTPWLRVGRIHLSQRKK